MKRRLTPDDLDNLVQEKEFVCSGTLTLCILTLTNGCTIVGKSNVINPDNYDEALGRGAAESNAKNQIWELEGYALKRDTKLLVERAARAGHEMNRIFCARNGDLTQTPWDFAPEWQKESAIAGAQNILDNPNTTPEQSHEKWLVHKEADGWKYGPVKNVEEKEHPCMVPYTQLPEHQRAKDEIFTTVVKAVLTN